MDEFKLSRLCLEFEDMKVPDLRFPKITLLKFGSNEKFPSCPAMLRSASFDLACTLM